METWSNSDIFLELYAEDTMDWRIDYSLILRENRNKMYNNA